MSDGKIDIWDLTKSILDSIMSIPILTYAKLKKVGLAPN